MSIPASAEPIMRRPLTVEEFTDLARRIDAAASVGELLTVAITGIFDVLISGSGRSLAAVTEAQPLDPTRYSIPSNQWQALLGAITRRADQWGCGPQLALEVVNVFPSSYDDPAATVPVLEAVDHRPAEIRITLSRCAADEIAASEAHLAALAGFYGPNSAEYLEARESWHRALVSVLSAHHGPEIRISRDGRMSLLVTAASMTFAVIFHGRTLVCRTQGCQATVSSKGSWYAASGAEIPGHVHEPSFLVDGPQPGRWSLHS